MMGAAGVADALRADFVDQVAEGRIRIDIDPPAEADADASEVIADTLLRRRA